MALPEVRGWANLGADPDVHRAAEGGKLRVTFSAAFNHKWLDKKTGNKVEETCWLRCVAWDYTAAQFDLVKLKCGALVFLIGRLHEQKRTAGQIFNAPALDAETDSREISQHELTVFEFHLPPPKLQ